jgi:hypothetical protein
MAANASTTTLTPEEAAFRCILSKQLRRYPHMEVQDLYKLILQASFGSEHAVSDLAAARRWLERELDELEPGPEEPMLDPISPDGRIVRIHLRPYLAAGRDRAELLVAFVRTAHEHRGRAATLQRYWDFAEQMAATDHLPFMLQELQTFFVAMQTQGFPAVHHTNTYTQSYHPAYRVVAHEFLV